MATSFGGTIKLQGESEYRKALSDISSNLRVLSSELKVVTSSYDKNDKSVENLASQNDVLNKKIDEQRKKVQTLEQALESAKNETGENSNTTKKWQVELNNAQAELNKLEKEVKNNEEAIDNFGKEEEDATQSTLKLGDVIKANLISETIISGIRALGSAMKTVGSALVDIGKQAIESYANYEQLVGGIETLFGAKGAKTVEEYAEKVGKSVDDVREEFDTLMKSQAQALEYANNAYSTAGLSANEYMETVTGFSASLLQGLGGDTEKSVEVANRAIIDMSDNANKMGTDMSSIMNAYQGFAKQNYTLLDNLKLGYGGTKTEMERLIKDASQLTDIQKQLGITVDGSSMSFDNIINAISVMQTKMDIAGTTSKEASTTIQGSTNMMKASWQNLITGIADDNADFSTLINNFVDSTITAMSNMLPRVVQVVSGIGELIGGIAGAILENLPMLIQTGKDLITGIASGITEAIPSILPIVQELISSLFTFLTEQAPLMIQSGVDMLNNIGQGLQENIPNFISKGLDLLQGFADFLTENVPILIQSGISFIRNMVQGLLQALPELIARVPELISQFANVINDNAPTIIMEGVGLIWDIITGLIQAIPDLIANIPQIIQAIVDVWQAFNWIQLGKNVVDFLGKGIRSMIDWAKSSIGTIKDGIINFIKDLPSNLWNIGKNAISDLGSAISSMIGWVVSNVTSVASNIINTLKSWLSPSNLADIGMNMIKGLWNGISNMAGWIIDKIGGFASSVLDSICNFFGIESPSKVFRDVVGKNLALGIGVGFEDTMKEVTDDMTSSIPTDFNIDANATPMLNSKYFDYDNGVIQSQSSNNDVVNSLSTIANRLSADNLYKVMVDAISDGGFTIVLDNREVGRLVKKYA